MLCQTKFNIIACVKRYAISDVGTPVLLFWRRIHHISSEPLSKFVLRNKASYSICLLNEIVNPTTSNPNDSGVRYTSCTQNWHLHPSHDSTSGKKTKTTCMSLQGMACEARHRTGRNNYAECDGDGNEHVDMDKAAADMGLQLAPSHGR